jgi:hypothetical protein
VATLHRKLALLSGKLLPAESQSHFWPNRSYIDLARVNLPDCVLANRQIRMNFILRLETDDVSVGLELKESCNMRHFRNRVLRKGSISGLVRGEREYR